MVCKGKHPALSSNFAGSSLNGPGRPVETLKGNRPPMLLPQPISSTSSSHSAFHCASSEQSILAVQQISFQRSKPLTFLGVGV